MGTVTGMKRTASARAATVEEAVRGLAEAVGEIHRLARVVTEPQHVQTAGLQVWPRQDEHGTPARAEASQQVTVRCPDLNSASQLLSDLSARVGENLRVDGLDLAVSDSRDAVVRAREAAFADARARAEHLAVLSDASLGAVVGVVELADGRSGRPMAERMAFAASMPIEPGQSAVTASVQMTWLLT
jgi:uncharacterized protein YggE